MNGVTCRRPQAWQGTHAEKPSLVLAMLGYGVGFRQPQLTTQWINAAISSYSRSVGSAYHLCGH